MAYEAYGQFLGKNAGSNKPGIPEEAYQVDYLITPDLREAAGVTSGLAEKGADILAAHRGNLFLLVLARDWPLCLL